MTTKRGNIYKGVNIDSFLKLDDEIDDANKKQKDRIKKEKTRYKKEILSLTPDNILTEDLRFYELPRYIEPQLRHINKKHNDSLEEIEQEWEDKLFDISTKREEIQNSLKEEKKKYTSKLEKDRAVRAFTRSLKTSPLNEESKKELIENFKRGPAFEPEPKLFSHKEGFVSRADKKKHAKASSSLQKKRENIKFEDKEADDAYSKLRHAIALNKLAN